MRDAAPALGVDPYTWILAGGDDHALVGDVPARRWPCRRLAGGRAGWPRASG